MAKQRKIEIGQYYEMLKPIEFLGVLPYGTCGRSYSTYRCICECGNIVDIPGIYIGRNSKSCGCLQRKSREREILPNTMFGRLKVIEKSNPSSRGYMYLCQCQCDLKSVILVSGERLRSGETKSCGCLHDELFSENRKKAYKVNFIKNTNVPKIVCNKLQSNNTSGVRGVYWHGYSKKWCAIIRFEKTTYYLGYYSDLETAKKARKKAEETLHGEFLEWYANNYPEQWKKIQNRKSIEQLE